MKEGKVTCPKELSLDVLLVSYNQFFKGSLKRGSIETIRAFLDTLEHLMDGSFACCHIVGGDNSPNVLDIYSSSAERAEGSVVLPTNGCVPEREDHWMECIGPKGPVFHEGRSIITCKRKGRENKFEVDGILSVPIVRSERVEAVISIANIRHPDRIDIERLSHAANIGWSICEVKMSDEALRESEARLKQAQRMGRMGNWVWDLEGNSIQWSDELYELYGVDPRTFQLTYDNILSRIHPEDRERNDRTVDMILEDRIGTSFNFRIIRSDSTIRSIHQIVEVETDHEGSIKRLIGTMLDVTELDELKSAIEENRDQLKVMFDQTPIMMCLLDGDRRITFCNKAFEEASGWPNTEFGSPFACGALGCINSLDDPRGCGFGPKCRSCRLFNAIEETWRTGSTHNDVEYSTILSRDGKRRELVLLGSTTKVRIGSRDKILLSLQDITPMKDVERAFYKSREQYKELYQRSTDPIFTLNRDMKIIDLNIAAIKLLSTPSETAIGKKVNEVLGLGLSYTNYLEGLADGKVTNQPNPVEIKLNRDDRTIHLELNHIKIKNEKGDEMVQLMFHDVTQRKVLEDQMKRSLLPYDVRDGAVHLVSNVPESAVIGLLKELQVLGYDIHFVIRPSAEERYTRSIVPTSVLMLDRGRLCSKELNYSKMVHDLITGLYRGDVLYLEDIVYIVQNDGFPEVLKLVQDMRDMAMLSGVSVLMAMDAEVLEPQQSKALMRECRPLMRMSLQSLPPDLKRLLDLILEANLRGENLDHTALSSLSGKSKPTVRKEVRALSGMGLVREYKHGRRKLIELTRNDLR